MHVILTHEQADFDALASLLGAYLLDDTAVPILPRRMNRNVRGFLTLYSLDLPFVDPRDLTGDPIDAITLVDTQGLISIKGMGTNTRVHVIDHHPLREDLPPDWSVTVSATGANTTILIETLRESGLVLSTVQSSLLLLGIYEDTGSLTYTRTTARDLRAASFLLDQGASLKIAADFLNHPLSQRQQILYDHLRATAVVKHVNGHTIIITRGDAQDLDEEISTIAHKLRDLLDPDALFVLVTTRGGVQLVARSTSDHIDVAEIASQFGGGGHERASASLIKGRSMDNIFNDLVGILPDYVRPAITVAQIMSRDPQLLSPDTSVEEAARRMQRYGHEGYPVVRDEKLVGLLTRRAVDRALAHKLNLTASSLMEAGEYTVRPDDSIEHLQRLMTDTDWGQIPVVDHKCDRIIGIVTRTDLLNTLTPRPRIPSRQNLAARLERALPPMRLALLKAVAYAAHAERSALYIVGGFVRDLLLDRPGLDFDLVVEGDAIALTRALASQFGGRVTSHARFGTAKWHIREVSQSLSDQLSSLISSPSKSQGSDLPDYVDLVSARTEFYTHPTALPTVERGSIKLDLHRRDFTFNTIALRLDGHHYGELHDYWGGHNDLRRGFVRVLHSLSFVDDPTRMLRAVRFEQRFGFRIEARTLELLQEALSLLDRVSGDRIRHEINTILVEDRVSQILARLFELNLLTAIHPDLRWDDWLRSRTEALVTDKPSTHWELWDAGAGGKIEGTAVLVDLFYVLWMVRIPPDQVRSVIARLKLSSDLKRTILSACKLWRELPSLENAPPSTIVDTLDDVSPQALYAVYLATDRQWIQNALHTYALQWRKIVPTISGHDLQERGLPTGPIYRSILKSLRNAWLDGFVSDQEEEAAFLDELISDISDI